MKARTEIETGERSTTTAWAAWNLREENAKKGKRHLEVASVRLDEETKVVPLPADHGLPFSWGLRCLDPRSGGFLEVKSERKTEDASVRARWTFSKRKQQIAAIGNIYGPTWTLEDVGWAPCHWNFGAPGCAACNHPYRMGLKYELPAIRAST